VDPDEFGALVDELNILLTQLRELTIEKTKAGLCLFLVGVLTCGVGMIFGGACYAYVTFKRFSVRFADFCTPKPGLQRDTGD
jgi:hypothetical protein